MIRVQSTVRQDKKTGGMGGIVYRPIEMLVKEETFLRVVL